MEENKGQELPENLNTKEEQSSDLHKTVPITGMYENWFLDYASYVILERAVPEVLDGLKPVQRRILHAMKDLDDGRYNKVANIIGHKVQTGYDNKCDGCGEKNAEAQRDCHGNHEPRLPGRLEYHGGQSAECCERRHQDRAKAPAACLMDRIER